MIKIDGKDMLVVDSHAHIWNRFDGSRFGYLKVHNLGYGKIKQGDDILDLVPPAFTDNQATIEILLGYMDDAKIDKAVILQNPCYGDQREYVKEVIAKYPDRIYAAIGKLDPRNVKKIVSEIDTLVKDFSCKGIKLEVPDVPFKMDAPEYNFMWKKLIDENLIVTIDLGWGTGEYDWNIGNLENVIKKYPALRVCIAHLGVCRLWDLEQKHPYPELQKLLKLTTIDKDNFYIDMCGMPFYDLTEEHPGKRNIDILKTVYETIGPDRIMFGTDFPSVLKQRTMKQCVDFMANHCDFFTAVDLVKVMGQNALVAYK